MPQWMRFALGILIVLAVLYLLGVRFDLNVN